MVSERDIKILRHVADGLTYREIAAEMKLSLRSIQQYIWYMQFDVGSSSLSNLVSMAYDLGILIPKVFVSRVQGRKEIIWKKPPKVFLRDSGDLLTGRKFQ